MSNELKMDIHESEKMSRRIQVLIDKFNDEPPGDFPEKHFRELKGCLFLALYAIGMEWKNIQNLLFYFTTKVKVRMIDNSHSIDFLGLDTQTCNRLESAGIYTVRQLFFTSSEYLNTIPFLGTKRLDRIKIALCWYKITYGKHKR